MTLDCGHFLEWQIRHMSYFLFPLRFRYELELFFFRTNISVSVFLHSCPIYFDRHYLLIILISAAVELRYLAGTLDLVPPGACCAPIWAPRRRWRRLIDWTMADAEDDHELDSFRRRLDGRGRRPHLCLDQASFWPHLGLAFGLIWTSSRPHLDLITASFGPHHGLIWTSPRTHLGLIPASFQPHFNLITFVIICSWFRCSFSFSFSD